MTIPSSPSPLTPDAPKGAEGAATGAVSKLDQIMEEASSSLVQRDYFTAERLAADALRAALNAEDFERAARICMPLLEARRLKRQQAADAGRIVVVLESVQDPGEIKPGCYLFCPPRVGAEARAFRQMADDARVPVIVLAREPVTRSGLCPIVAVGPVTVRAMVAEPAAGARPASKPKKPKTDTAPTPPVSAFGAFVTPGIEWMLATCEALGDAAIEQSVSPSAADRAMELYARLQSVPDHEKLHQRLMEACEAAVREPRRASPPRQSPTTWTKWAMATPALMRNTKTPAQSRGRLFTHL
ncbi:MAG: hypothetical protein QM783_15045 [Phycisphaerales bacterium]